MNSYGSTFHGLKSITGFKTQTASVAVLLHDVYNLPTNCPGITGQLTDPLMPSNFGACQLLPTFCLHEAAKPHDLVILTQ